MLLLPNQSLHAAILCLILIIECSTCILVNGMMIRTTQKTPFIARRSTRLISASTNTIKKEIIINTALHSTTKKSNNDNVTTKSNVKVTIKLNGTTYIDNTNITNKHNNNSDLLLASIASSPSVYYKKKEITQTKKSQGKKKTEAKAGRRRSNSNDSSGSSSDRSTTSGTKVEYKLFSADIEKINPKSKWVDLQVPPSELRPSASLTTGQCFNWHVIQSDNNDDNISIIGTSPTSPSSSQKLKSSAWGIHNAIEWVGPIGNSVVSIRETPTTTLYRLIYTSSTITADYDDADESFKNIIQDYFQLSTINLTKLYKKWSKCDPNKFAPIAECIPGVRLLRQDPFECLISFLCSSNNNIPRITLMLSRIRSTYGQKLIDLPQRSSIVDDNDCNTTLLSIYSFPKLNDLVNVTENDLRLLGLGYRSKYVHQTCSLLQSLGGEIYLHNLRHNNNNKSNNASIIQKELLQFNGIGRKVADCIALFSLDVNDAIPVDIHVWNIACRDYDPTLLDDNVKSLTPTIYNRVANLFKNVFDDEYSGWAHSILFVAELPSFKSVLPVHIVEDMEKFKREEKERKKKRRS